MLPSPASWRRPSADRRSERGSLAALVVAGAAGPPARLRLRWRRLERPLRRRRGAQVGDVPDHPGAARPRPSPSAAPRPRPPGQTLPAEGQDGLRPGAPAGLQQLVQRRIIDFEAAQVRHALQRHAKATSTPTSRASASTTSRARRSSSTRSWRSGRSRQPTRATSSRTSSSRQALFNHVTRGIRFTDADAKKYYDAEHRPVQGRGRPHGVSHILVPTKAEADKIRAEVTPQNFAQLAQEVLDRHGHQGHRAASLGQIQKGQFVPEFEKVAFALKRRRDLPAGQDAVRLAHHHGDDDAGAHHLVRRGQGRQIISSQLAQKRQAAYGGWSQGVLKKWDARTVYADDEPEAGGDDGHHGTAPRHDAVESAAWSRVVGLGSGPPTRCPRRLWRPSRPRPGCSRRRSPRELLAVASGDAGAAGRALGASRPTPLSRPPTPRRTAWRWRCRDADTLPAARRCGRAPSAPRSRPSPRWGCGCGATAPGTASRRPRRSCRTRSRRRSRWRTPWRQGGAGLADELGDLLFQSVFLAQLLEERGAADLALVARGQADKLSAATRTSTATRRPERHAAWWTSGSGASARSAAGQGIFHELPAGLPALAYATKAQSARRRSASTSPASTRRWRSSTRRPPSCARIRGRASWGTSCSPRSAAARALGADPELALRASAQRFRERVEGAERAGGRGRRPSSRACPPTSSCAGTRHRAHGVAGMIARTERVGGPGAPRLGGARRAPARALRGRPGPRRGARRRRRPTCTSTTRRTGSPARRSTCSRRWRGARRACRGASRRCSRGERINVTEGRPALHVALRAPRDAVIEVDGHNVVPDVHDVLDRMADLADRVRSGAWTGATGERIRARGEHRHRGLGPRPGDGLPGARATGPTRPSRCASCRTSTGTTSCDAVDGLDPAAPRCSWSRRRPSRRWRP